MKQSGGTARAERNPDQTRQRILEAAFTHMYRSGFQGMRLDDVLADTGLTKGALYHHFPNKQALGYAVIDELLGPMVESIWIQPIEGAADTLQGLMQALESMPAGKPPEMLVYGCPLNNLAQEMSPLDEGFRTRIDRLFSRWHQVTADALEQARQSGRIRADIDTEEVATFIVAAVEGCIGIAKNAQSLEMLERCHGGLIHFVKSLGSEAQP